MLKKTYMGNSKITWYHDDIHPNKKGHKLIGDFLSIKLLEMYPSILSY